MNKCSVCSLILSDELLLKKLEDNTLWCEMCLLRDLKLKFDGIQIQGGKKNDNL